MGKRWFRTGNEIKSMHGGGRNAGMLVLGWLASMVLVAAVAVMLTYRFTAPRAGGTTARVGSAGEASPTTTGPGSPSRTGDGNRPAPVTESSDTRRVGDAASGDGPMSTPEGGSGEHPRSAQRTAAATPSDGTGAFRTIPAPQSAHGSTAATDGAGPSPDARSDAQEGPTYVREGSLGLVETAQLSPPPRSQAVVTWCRKLGARVEGVSPDECMSDGFVDTGARSVEGRPMVLRRIEATTEPAMGRILLISATHGDEPSSVGAAFGWMSLMRQRGTRYDWRIVPTLNPDGLFHEPATRLNANGVDLNRNLPTTNWAEKSRAYWRRVGFEKRRYPGESAGSEPESAWLVKQIRAFRPDVIISLHAPYGVLDYDGDFPAPQRMGRLNLHQLGVYPGSLGNFGARMNSIPVITVELDSARQAPRAQEIERMWVDLNNWLDRYFRSVRQVRAAGNASEAG